MKIEYTSKYDANIKSTYTDSGFSYENYGNYQVIRDLGNQGQIVKNMDLPLLLWINNGQVISELVDYFTFDRALLPVTDRLVRLNLEQDLCWFTYHVVPEDSHGDSDRAVYFFDMRFTEPCDRLFIVLDSLNLETEYEGENTISIDIELASEFEQLIQENGCEKISTPDWYQ